MSESVLIIARVAKVNGNLPESFELESLGVVELYPSAKQEGEKVPARSPEPFVAES